jgi:hypothetical protein
VYSKRHLPIDRRQTISGAGMVGKGRERGDTKSAMNKSRRYHVGLELAAIVGVTENCFI